MVNVVDDNLNAVLQTLRPSERLALRRHLAGVVTDESRELIKRIKASLKRRARNKLPRRFVWLA